MAFVGDFQDFWPSKTIDAKSVRKTWERKMELNYALILVSNFISMRFFISNLNEINDDEKKKLDLLIAIDE